MKTNRKADILEYDSPHADPHILTIAYSACFCFQKSGNKELLEFGGPHADTQILTIAYSGCFLFQKSGNNELLEFGGPACRSHNSNNCLFCLFSFPEEWK